MKIRIRDLIKHCHCNICENCIYHNDNDNSCSALIHGSAPYLYYNLMTLVICNSVTTKDILYNKEVEIDENNSKRTN